MVKATVKQERLEEYKKLASALTKESRARSGCVTYIFNQSSDVPTEFVLYEQWENESDLEKHLQALLDLLGPPKSGGLLPAKLIDMYEKAEVTYYNAIE